MNTQKKHLKKKEREAKVKVKLARRREAIQKQAAAKKLQESQWEAEYRLQNGPMEPILTNPEAILAREERKKADVEKRLKRNLAILEMLERQYDQEQEVRKELNESLEAEGHHTIKDKMAALHTRAKELQEKVGMLPQIAQGAVPAVLTDEEEKSRQDECALIDCAVEGDIQNAPELT